MGRWRILQNLLSQAHARGIHVILDMVLNHTSNQNPWFINSNNNVPLTGIGISGLIPTPVTWALWELPGSRENRDIIMEYSAQACRT